MAEHDYIISNASGAAVRSDLNDALAAIVSNNSKASAPSTTYAYQMWADTGSSPAMMRLRNSANTDWITLYNLDGSSLPIASATEIVFNDAGADLDFRIEGDTEANLFFIDAGNDRVGIGTNAPTYNLDVESSGDTVIRARSSTTANPSFILSEDNNTKWQIQSVNNSDNRLRIIDQSGDEVVKIEQAGDVAIGTGTGTNAITINGSSSGTSLNRLIFHGGGTNNPSAAIEYDGADQGLAFQVGNYSALSSSERMRITTAGDVLFNTTANTPAPSNVTGVAISTGTFGGYVSISRDGDLGLDINRKTNDGNLVRLIQDGTVEGTISVSGTTVSYNGAHLARWSQLPSGAERTEILRGSVLSNIDEMCEWAYEAEAEVLWTEDDELPEGVNVGDVKTPAKAAGTEDNEQLNRMQVSDVEGDRNVAGVFQAWDDDDDTYTNDFYCAMTGDFVIRIAQDVTVERGDLLMSAGDGTAKPQEDDIIRSKTIAKVTSTNVSCAYDDGSYCVPCVLMAC